MIPLRRHYKRKGGQWAAQAKAIAGIADETSAQVRMFNSTNASSNKPTLVVTYKPDYYGNAKAYVQKTGDGVNCLGYAMGINASVQPSDVGGQAGRTVRYQPKTYFYGQSK